MTLRTEKRLNKFISDSGFCSRREADRLVEQNRVTINDCIPELGTKVQPEDIVKVDGTPIGAVRDDKKDRIYIAYHKPVGITCTTESRVKGNIIDAVRHTERVFPIGRLDKPSEGLIFLTSDGDIVNKILRAENAHDKEYSVTVDKPITQAFIQKMAQGVPILDTVTQPCTVTQQSRFVFTIILTQGLNRQIRRMAEHLGYRVTRLIRNRIMNVHLGNLKPNEWRDLTSEEMAEINQAVSGSSKVALPKNNVNAKKHPKKRVKTTKDASTPRKNRNFYKK
ncbi:MAG: 23S rRNA pseudouridine(2604) synthase RluF [Thiomicrorhabdus sp.]|nr:23S rRNA pseudouridine(2604) synthase RluF [Thiomicrorhabdus sp.]